MWNILFPLFIISTNFKHKDFYHQLLNMKDDLSVTKTVFLRSLKKIQKAAKIQEQREPLLKIFTEIFSILRAAHLINTDKGKAYEILKWFCRSSGKFRPILSGSYLQMFYNTSVQNFAKFIGKHASWSFSLATL